MSRSTEWTECPTYSNLFPSGDRKPIGSKDLNRVGTGGGIDMEVPKFCGWVVILIHREYINMRAYGIEIEPMDFTVLGGQILTNI